MPAIKKNNKKRGSFPFYLAPGPDRLGLLWLGARLTEIRNSRSIERVAKEAKTSVAEIAALEKGIFHITLGRLREIIEQGYRVRFENLLAQCYAANREHFDPSSLRPFERDFHYTVSHRRDGNGKLSPTLLVGGDPKRYVWAVPMRRLRGQPLVTSLLELAPSRKLQQTGSTQDNNHDGAEIIHVIHGTVYAHVTAGGEAVNTRVLKAGDYIHFLSRQTHRFENCEKGTSALLLIVQVPDLKGRIL